MYAPTKNLIEGIRNAFPAQLFPWDDYFPRMAETDWLCGSGEVLAVKSFFIRNAPFHGSYTVLGGITAALRGIADLYLGNPDFSRGMIDMGYDKRFVEWLTGRADNLRLKVYAPREGDLIFPNEPAVTMVGPLPDVRLAEGILTEALNFPTLNITKWHRLVRTVRPGRVLDFSRRRAQNDKKATLYGMLAGCFATSNSEMRRFFNFSVSGTMGHEWVQRFGDVKLAFKTWLDYQPYKPVGLVDTKQCMEHDFPIWLEEVEARKDAIKAANPAFWGWRNDSGDLADLTIEQYVRFFRYPLAKDEWFRDRMRIVLTNELDEYSAENIISQIRTQAGAAGLDAEDIIRRIIWAAGTKPSTCDDQPSLGGVAKLMEVENFACIKLAFDPEGRPGPKTSIPGFNLSALVRDGNGEIKCCLIFPQRRYALQANGRFYDKNKKAELDTLVACHPDNPAVSILLKDYVALPQQRLVWDSFSPTGDGFTADWDNPTIDIVPKRIQENVDRLHWSMGRLEKPSLMKVYLTKDLFELRQSMILNGVLREDKRNY